MKTFKQFIAESDATISPQFFDWFRDSTVLDGQGNPLVVYHGSDTEVTSFDTTEVRTIDTKRLGTYFSASKRFAATYGTHIHEVYLNIVSPFDITDMNAGEVINLLPVPDQAKRELRSAFKGTDYSQYGLLESAQRFGLRPDLERDGYDGIKYTEGYADAYIVFSPTQIKSATNNNGNFDYTSSMINESTIKLSELYDYDELDDMTEALYNWIDKDTYDVDFTIQEMSPEQAMTLKTPRDDTTVWNAFRDFATKDQHRIVKYKMEHFDPERVVVIANQTVIDGNHQVIAALKLNRPVRYIDVYEDINENI